MAEPCPPSAEDAVATSADYVQQAGERRSTRIESLRALAALGVLIGHAYGWAHGYQGVIYGSYHGRLLLSGGFGVFLFFALSGYLLYLPFVRAAQRNDRIDLGRYLLNRALRVLPLYYVVITVYLAVRGEGLHDQWWRFALFLQSFSAQTVARVDGPVWSLVVEVQFYVLLPVFAWLIARFGGRSAARAAGAVAALGIAAFVVRMLTVTTADSVTSVWQYSLPATCVFFFPGLLLAHLKVGLERSPRRWPTRAVTGSSTLWFAAGAALWLVVACRFRWDALFLPACALLLGACVLPLRPGLPVKALDARWLGALGIASYSLYLWHEPIIHALATSSWVPDGFVPVLLIGVVVCCAVALASYRLIESPFLRLRRTWSARRATTAPTADMLLAADPA